MSESTTTFSGWHRTSRQAHWQRVCQGETWKACYQRLLACTRRQGGATCVLPQGRHPDRPEPIAAETKSLP
jgi:hypothetical protein